VIKEGEKADDQSYNAYLDTDDPEPTAPMVLTKILASSFTIHGNHFAVLKHLHPNDAQDFHTSSISKIFSKIATYVTQERRAGRNDTKAHYAAKRAQCLTIFKCLILLLGPVNGRGALKIKSEMEAGLRDVVGIEVGGNKMWEGYRAYEKRLVLIASKDSNIRAGAARVVEQEQELEQEQEQQVEERTEGSVSPTPNDNGPRELSLGLDEDMDVELPEVEVEMDFGLDDLEPEQEDEEEAEEETTPKSNGKSAKRSAGVNSESESTRPTKKSKSKK
jgi:cohesin complex subunit SA-1/2